MGSLRATPRSACAKMTHEPCHTLGRLRGRVHHYGPQRIPVIVTYHPAYLLRTPADKRKAWEDLRFAVRVFRERLVEGGQ